MSAFITHVTGVSDRFAITFDDGPSPTWTPRVLDVLARARVRATFFPLAPNLRRRPALARRAVEAGHELGVHGEWHLPPPMLPWALLRHEIRCGIAAATPLARVAPRFYRPAFGMLGESQSAHVRAMGLLPVLGNVYPRDVERPGVHVIVERVMASLRPGSIVILHDSSGIGDFDRSQSVTAAERILAAAAERGLRAGTVGELLAAPGAVPDAAWAAPASR